MRHQRSTHRVALRGSTKPSRLETGVLQRSTVGVDATPERAPNPVHTLAGASHVRSCEVLHSTDFRVIQLSRKHTKVHKKGRHHAVQKEFTIQKWIKPQLLLK